MARRTRKKGNINNVINTAPPIVLAIVYIIYKRGSSPLLELHNSPVW